MKMCGTPGRIRTCGLRIRSPTLYPAELRAHDRCHERGFLLAQGHESVKQLFAELEHNEREDFMDFCYKIRMSLSGSARTAMLGTENRGAR